MSTITSAGGIISIMHQGVCHILAIRYPTGRIAFPKGRQDPGETLEQTAVREVEEETGLRELTIIQELGSVTYRSENPEQRMHEKTMHLFLMTAEARVAEQEENCCWVPLAEAIQLMELPGERDLLTKNATLIAQHSSTESIWN